MVFGGGPVESGSLQEIQFILDSRKNKFFENRDLKSKKRFVALSFGQNLRKRPAIFYHPDDRS
ncbi:MAG: hypothetical protein V1758_07040, partial [Pseudomonadota bacterium]